MTFLHWAYDPEAVRPLLPEGVEIDTFDGRAWVSLVAFLVTGFRVPGLPAVPGLSRFSQANVRTYARGPEGRDGIVFLDLEGANLAAVLAARLVYRVPDH